jgi:hypothetical protein
MFQDRNLNDLHYLIKGVFDRTSFVVLPLNGYEGIDDFYLMLHTQRRFYNMYYTIHMKILVPTRNSTEAKRMPLGPEPVFFQGPPAI